MGKVKRGGYLFVTWKGDHPPKHVHVYDSSKLVLKFNQEKRVAMSGHLTRRILQYIVELERKGRL